jgi:hypothetical protein
MKTLPVEAELLHADGQTDRQTDMTKLKVAETLDLLGFTQRRQAVPKRRYVITTRRCVKPQNSVDLTYSAAAARNRSVVFCSFPNAPITRPIEYSD